MTDIFPAAQFIKEIGRGKKGARSLTRTDAYRLYEAMLNERVSDLELGAIMIALRIKGESVEEIAGFLDAAEASYQHISLDVSASSFGNFAPIIIPSYNGSRNMPNLTPLLILLLSQKGIPALVHGVTYDPGRVTTAEILQLMGYAPANSIQQAQDLLLKHEPAFIPIDVLAPRLARLLEVRRILGVRNSTHTLVKMLQPFIGPALRLVSYTHPEYFTMLTEYFTNAAPHDRGDIFLMKGTEGETVANAKRGQAIDWFHHGEHNTLIEKQSPVDINPPLIKETDAHTTAAWIQTALQNPELIPQGIVDQVECCRKISQKLGEQKN